MVGHLFFVHASNKNFESLNDLYHDFLNVPKNKYSVNQRRGCWMKGSCKLQYLGVIANGTTGPSPQGRLSFSVIDKMTSES